MLLAGILLLVFSAAAVPAAAAGENFLVMYVVGSDLETNYGYASGNLIDLANNLDPSAGDVIICYGGANKTGWDDGVTVTNLSLLKKDVEDGVIGVDTDTGKVTGYILTKIPGDISTPEVLASSVAYADTYGTENGLTDATRYLIFWNHGAAWYGFGINDLTKRTLSNAEIHKGLSAAEKYDMIIFNACLMASLEASSVLYQDADYLLASEETTPAIQGLNYTAFTTALSKNPSMTPVEFAGVLMDTYVPVDIGTHFPKIYALVDLNKIPDVLSALSDFGTELNRTLAHNESLNVIGSIYSYTQDFGVYGGGGPAGTLAYSQDLYEFVTLVKAAARDEQLQTAATDLLNALDEYCVLSESNGGFRSANGVSIISPKIYSMITNSGTFENVSESVRKSVQFGNNNGWDTFMQNYTLAVRNADKITSAKLENTSQNVTVTGSAGTTQATINYLYEYDGRYVSIGDVPLEESIVASDNSLWKYMPTGKYTFPKWNGKWIVLKNPGDTDGVIISAQYFNDGATGQNTYLVMGNLTRTINGTAVTHPSYLQFSVNTETLEPYYLVVGAPDPDAPLGGSRNLWTSTEVLPGDIFTPELFLYDTETDTISKTVRSEQNFVFGANPLENIVAVPFDADKLFWYFKAEDVMDMSTYIIPQPDLPDSAATPAAPAPIFGILAGFCAAAVLLKRK